MTHYYTNEAIDASFVVRDNTETAITGLTASSFATREAYLLPTGATTSTVTITEIGAGEYAATFTPTAPGTWTLHLIYTGVTPQREIKGDYVVTTRAAAAESVGLAGTGSTLGGLRRRVAHQMGDLVTMEATATADNTSSFKDSLNINAGAEHYTGRELIFTSGVDAGTVVRITGTTESSGLIQFSPAVSVSPVSGTTADMVNKKSRGNRVVEYHRSIQHAIKDAFPLGLAERQEEYNPDDESPAPESTSKALTVSTPSEFIEVYALEWQDDSDDWHPIPHAPNTYTPGWRGIPTTGQIEIRGPYATYAEGMRLRLSGYARHDHNLVDDNDATDLNEEWIVARACYHLSLLGMDRDSSRGSMVTVYQREADMLKPRIRTVRRSGTERIRSAS